MSRIVITGGSGFIGTNLIDSLIRTGNTLINIDISAPVKESHFSFWKPIDILDYDALEEVIMTFSPDVIIHLSAVTDLNGNTLSYYSANIQGTKNIIDIAARLKCLKKVIFTSSMYVCKPGFIPDNYDTYQPHTKYGESKVQGELLVKAIKSSHYSWIIIRPTSIWGPWFNIPYIDFFKMVYKGNYFDFGKACSKTYGFISNTVFQIQKLMEADNVHAKTFYLGDKPPIQISEWAEEISIEMGKGKIKKIPFKLLKFVAKIGDYFKIVNVKFPLTSFRLKNMTTNNILPLDDLYEITGPSPISRLEGVKETTKWLVEYKGYKI